MTDLFRGTSRNEFRKAVAKMKVVKGADARSRLDVEKLILAEKRKKATS